MSNGEVCCILGVCCPPGSEAQRDALIQMIHKTHPHKSDKAVENAADRVLRKFDNFSAVAVAIEEDAA